MFYYIHTMFTIEYIAPYTQAVRQQSFASLEEAQSMIAFYQSCGTDAWLVWAIPAYRRVLFIVFFI